MGIVEDLVQKTYDELASSSTPAQDSRSWKDPEGYRYLFPWSNLVLLRFLVRLLTNSLPAKEFRRKTQIDDAARSSVRNIEEGFKRPTTKEYLEFLGFSQGSLEEVKGDIRELTEDGFLKSIPGLSLEKLGIDLKEFNLALRNNRQKLEGVRGKLKEDKIQLEDVRGELKDDRENKENYLYKPLTVLYPPLKSLNFADLSYEVFIELINKTDFLLRKLVVSLEQKLNTDRKSYQIEQIRLNRYAKTG